MGSRKPSAKAKQVEAFRSQLGGMDDLFAREEARRENTSMQREAALRNKACESKNRYSSRAEAQEAIRACEELVSESVPWPLTHCAQ